jgi:hypothetical protein
VWPIGATAVCLLLLLKARKAIVAQKSTVLSRSVSFLHHEFKPNFFFWEVLLLLERIVITGALVLIPHNLLFFRIFAALLVASFGGCVTMLAMPYKKSMHNHLSVAMHVGIWGILLGGLCVKLHNNIKESEELEEIDVTAYVLGISNVEYANAFEFLHTALELNSEACCWGFGLTVPCALVDTASSSIS